MPVYTFGSIGKGKQFKKEGNVKSQLVPNLSESITDKLADPETAMSGVNKRDFRPLRKQSYGSLASDQGLYEGQKREP